MDGNRTERGRHRHRHRARTDHPSAVGDPQWSDVSSDRPEWTERAGSAQLEEPRSWFGKHSSAGADEGAGWRPVSDLTDTAWGLDGVWRDPSAQWNVAGRAPEAGGRRPGLDRAGWDRDTAWGARDPGGAQPGNGAWGAGDVAPAGGAPREGAWRGDVAPAGAAPRDGAWDAGRSAPRNPARGTDDSVPGDRAWGAGDVAPGDPAWGRGSALAGGGWRDTPWGGDTALAGGPGSRDTAWGGEPALTGGPGSRDTAWGGEPALTGGPGSRDTAWGGEPALAGGPGSRDTAWGGEPALTGGASHDTAWSRGDAGSRDAAWGAGDGPTGAGGGGWNAPTDAAWAGAAGGPAVAVLDRPEEPAGAPEKKHSVRHPVRIALFALVLFGLVAGSVAWLSMDKSVTLTVDGDARAVKTYASTVGGVLDDQKITVGEHDTLAPGRDTRISDGAEIVLRRGRLVTLTVDGTTRKVWTTALTVQEALEQIGYRQDRMWMSADRSTRLPLDGYQLTLRMAKSVTIVADGKKRTISTTAATVGEALDQAGLSVDADDKVSQLSTAPVRAGMTITVTRMTTKTTTTQTVVEFETVEKTDPYADPGSRTVQTKGVTGLQQVTTVQTYVNGKLTSSKVTKRVLVKKPVDEVVVVGPEPQESTPPPAQPAGCEDFPTTGGLNWCGLAQCESGLDPNAYNPAGPYYGLYQFDIGTWQANGGTGTPAGKSIAEQTRVAYNLYQARGRAPWPVCGKNL
jgi:uncharacterized protein YabE (DUF348 family)